MTFYRVKLLYCSYATGGGLEETELGVFDSLEKAEKALAYAIGHKGEFEHDHFLTYDISSDIEDHDFQIETINVNNILRMPAKEDDLENDYEEIHF